MVNYARFGVVILVIAGVNYAIFRDRYPTDLGVGCAADAGPTALVAYDGQTGEKRWTAGVGFHTDIAIVDGVVEVEARHRRTRLDVATGRQLSCVDLDGQIEPLAAAATEQPEFRLAGESEAWRARMDSGRRRPPNHRDVTPR